MPITLTPTSQDELDRRLPDVIEGYARANAASRGLPLDEARADAARQSHGALPDGVRTSGMLLFSARDERGDIVGWVWLALPGDVAGGPDRAWVYNIEVDPAHRGRGHGRAIMLAAERELADRGVDSLGLNVHGHNTTAIRLYDSLGFVVYHQQMAKPLDPADGYATGPGGEVPRSVALRPMTQDELDARLPAVIEKFAQVHVDTRHIPLAEARERATREVEQGLPDGVRGKGALLRTARTADGAEIGWYWVSLPGGFGGPGRAWLMNIEVDPARRRRGHGRTMLLAMERELVERGVPAVGLNVVGGNVAAARLYDSLGYVVVGQQMSKPITVPATP